MGEGVCLKIEKKILTSNSWKSQTLCDSPSSGPFARVICPFCLEDNQE